MANRKQVFQSKVLQKLYPVSSTLRKEHSPPLSAEPKAKTSSLNRKACGQDTVGDAGKCQNAASPRPRMYTVLPPPPDYQINLDESVSLPQLKSINSDEDPAGESVHSGNEEVDEQNEQRRRRRRKRKKTSVQDNGRDGTPSTESSIGQSQAPGDEGECMSKNKKRKQKKKRHKEKLMAMGLMRRAAPLDFTYNKAKEEEEEEEDNERRAAELSDFLRTTKEIYMSDSSLPAVRTPHLSAAVDALLLSIESGNHPDSALKQLCSLKAFVQHKDTNGLEKALVELSDSPSMSTEETTAVVSLFKYWITDILPLQRIQETRRSTASL